MAVAKIISKLNQRIGQVNSLLCVGLDSDLGKIPNQFRSCRHPQFEFNKWIIDQTQAQACAYKVNFSFYEARGVQGWQELKLTVKYLQQHHPQIITIADAKRADIDNTNRGYVKSIFDQLQFDCVTLNPYLGFQALSPFISRTNKGLIILCRTSNPGAGELQDLLIDGNKPLWEVVAEKAATDWNTRGNIMLVVGATYPAELKRVREITGEMTLLVPGIGAQGGDVEATVKAGLNSNHQGMIINSSRGIIFNDNPAHAARTTRDEINQYR